MSILLTVYALLTVIAIVCVIGSNHDKENFYDYFGKAVFWVGSVTLFFVLLISSMMYWTYSHGF